MTGSPLRIGVLGASRIAELAIVGPAQELGHRLVAVAARDPHRAAIFADKYGVERVVGSYRDLIDDPEVDVVYNPLANSLHAPWNSAAVRAGKPVLTEKPYARNRSEAQQVAQAAAAAGVPVVEAFHYLYHPVTQRLLELISAGVAGEIGALRHVEVHMAMPAPADGDPRWALDLAGGALMDLGCYGLHIMRQVGRIVGATPDIVSAKAVERAAGVDATCEVDLRIGEVTAHSTYSMQADDYHFTVRARGASGEALVHNFIKPQEDDRLTVSTATGTRTERLGTRPSYTYQLEAFAAHLTHGRALPVDGTDAVENMALIDDAYRAAGLSPR